VSDAKVNSQAYWEERFEADWEAKQGREQTRFFARAALARLRPEIAQEIREERLSVCDWGCALGDAVPLLADAFGGTEVVGVDFSARAVEKARGLHPAHAFLAARDLDEVGRAFDVVFTSNTLEHLERPIDQLERLAAVARRYVIVLVPFEERDRIEEHLVTFTLDSFPLRVGSHHLVFADEFDLSRDQPTWWNGWQILVVYARDDAAADRLRGGARARAG
jgi:Methyltransferase domain